VPDPCQAEPGVADGVRRQRRCQLDVEPALALDLEAGGLEPGTPVLVHVHAALAAATVEFGVEAVLQLPAGGVAEEPGERVELGDHEDAARLQGGVHPGDRAGRVGQMVHGGRRPDEVDRAEVGPDAVEVGPDGVDAVGDPGRGGAAAQVGQHVLVEVDGGEVGVGQVAGQAQRAGSAAGTQVDDARAGGGEGSGPGDDLAVVLVEDLGVEVEQLGQVVVGHAPTLAESCVYDIRSCV
jgi:hypothetical protein